MPYAVQDFLFHSTNSKRTIFQEVYRAIDYTISILAILLVLLWRLPPSFLFRQYPSWDKDFHDLWFFYDWGLFMVFVFNLTITYNLAVTRALKSMIRVRNNGKDKLESSDNELTLSILKVLHVLFYFFRWRYSDILLSAIYLSLQRKQISGCSIASNLLAFCTLRSGSRLRLLDCFHWNWIALVASC